MYNNPNAHCSYCGTPFPEAGDFPKTCTHCENTTYLNPTVVAVVALPVDDGVLVVRRGEPAGEGELAFPGGFIESGESWEVKETKNMLDEEVDGDIEPDGKNKEDEILNSDDEESEDAADLLEDEFEPVTNEDLLEDYIQENKLVPEVTDEDGLKEIELDQERSESEPDEFIEEEGIKTDLSELDEIGKDLLEEDEKNIDGSADFEKIELDEIDLELDDYENDNAGAIPESEVSEKIEDEVESKNFGYGGGKG